MLRTQKSRIYTSETCVSLFSGRADDEKAMKVLFGKLYVHGASVDTVI